MSDFTVIDGGSIVLLTPVSESAAEWVAEHLPEDGQMLGDAHAIERRYFADIYHGIINDGLTLA
jgi:hypothetical protein